MTQGREKRKTTYAGVTAERMREVQKLGQRSVVKHGLQTLRATAPEHWPEPLRTLYTDRVNELLAMPHIDPTRHRGAVLQCVRAETIVARLHQYAAERGYMDEGAGDCLPVMRTLPMWEGFLSRQYQLLGLTPMVSRRVVIKGDGLLSALAGIQDAEHEDTSAGTNGHDNEGESR